MADGDVKGAPLVILEAFALASPSPPPDTPKLPRASRKRDGIFAIEHDVDALVEAMIMLGNATLRERTGEAGRDLLEQHHDIATLNRE